MIRLSTLTGPVTVRLTGSMTGVTLTLRRLNSVDFGRCTARAMDIVRDRAALSQVITRNGLVESAADLNRALNDLAFQGGFAAWLGSVECGLAAITAWEGVTGADGAPAPLARKLVNVAGNATPADPDDLAARLTMEALMLDQGFERQVLGQIDLAARILVREGNASGLSANGSAVAPSMTPEGPPGAETATAPEKPAPAAAGTGPDGSVP